MECKIGWMISYKIIFCVKPRLQEMSENQDKTDNTQMTPKCISLYKFLHFMKHRPMAAVSKAPEWGHCYLNIQAHSVCLRSLVENFMLSSRNWNKDHIKRAISMIQSSTVRYGATCLDILAISNHPFTLPHQ